MRPFSPPPLPTVSPTVIRESVKRLEKKGLITVTPGRGTIVEPTTPWNILDGVVLSVMLENDDSLGVLDDLDEFPDADLPFHFLVVTLSRNVLASNITKILFSRARQSSRFLGHRASDAHQVSLDEHRRVYEAIAAGDVARAEQAMRSHIIDAWQRRRFPTLRSGQVVRLGAFSSRGLPEPRP